MDCGSAVTFKERTEHQTVNFKLEWTIANFSLYIEAEHTMFCSGVTMADLGVTDCKGRFRISIKPCRFDSDTDRKYVSAFLCITDTPVDSRVYNGEEEIKAEFQMRYNFSEESSRWGFPELVSHSVLFDGAGSAEALIKDNCITISADVKLYLKANTICVAETPGLSDQPQRHRKFIQRQLNLFESENYGHSTDFILRSMDGRQFRISRFLLMAQSPVFNAMLTHDTKERRSSRCELTDVNGECVEILSAYISGCDIGKINGSNAEKALIMADKYQLMDLRSFCEEILAGNVNEGNAVHYLILARQRELASLKEAALRLVPRHMGAVLSDAALAEMVTSDPEAMQMIMEHCSKRVRYVFCRNRLPGDWNCIIRL